MRIPGDINSMKQLAGVLFPIKRFDEGKNWQKMVLNEDGADVGAAYTIGVIDWMQAHGNLLQALQSAGFVDDGAGNLSVPNEVLAPIQAQNQALAEEALHPDQRQSKFPATDKQNSRCNDNRPMRFHALETDQIGHRQAGTEVVCIGQDRAESGDRGVQGGDGHQDSAEVSAA